MNRVRWFFLLPLLLWFPGNVCAHPDGDVSLVGNAVAVSEDSLGFGEDYAFEWEQCILPVSLMAAGASALFPGQVRELSRDFTCQVISLRGDVGRLSFDDYLQYLPVTGALALGTLGVESRHSLEDRALVLAVSYTALALLTRIPKYCIDEKRPEFAGHNSFPSGHTATAFMGAELVRMEYGAWYGVGAYAMAFGVGFMRMYNGRHWFHDVLAGAGVGILSARIGQWSIRCLDRILPTSGTRHKERPANNNLVLMPVMDSSASGCYGLSLACRF